MSKASKLLVRMKASNKDWGREDMETLYLGYGFKKKAGGKHDLYKHPDYPQLMATVGRHNVLATGYVDTAIELIRQLEEFEAAKNQPPAPGTS